MDRTAGEGRTQKRWHKLTTIPSSRAAKEFNRAFSAPLRALANLYLLIVHACATELAPLSHSNTAFHVRPPNALSAWLGLQSVPPQTEASPSAQLYAAELPAQFEW